MNDTWMIAAELVDRRILASRKPMHHRPAFGTNPHNPQVGVRMTEQRLPRQSALVFAKHECVGRAIGDMAEGVQFAVYEDTHPVASRGSLSIGTRHAYVIGLSVTLLTEKEPTGPA